MKAEWQRSFRLARRLLRFSLPYWRWSILALVLILVMSGLINYLPILIKQITDNCLMDQTLPAETRWEELLRLSGIFVLFAVSGHLLRYAQGVLTAWLGQRILYDLRVTLFRKVINMHLGYYDRTPIGALMTRVTSDIERLQAFVTDGVVGTIADVVMLITIMLYMLIIDVQVALALFAVLPFLFVALLYVNGKLRDANRDIRERQSKLNALLQEYLVGMTTIQLFNHEPVAREEFRERNAHLQSAYFDEVRWFSYYFPVIEAGQAAAFVAILGVGGYLLLNDSGLMTLGVLIAFLTYIRDFFRPLGSLSDKAGMYQTAMVSAERIFALLDTPETIAEPAQPCAPQALSGTIEFRNVWFAYQEENWVIKDLSFLIQPGQVIAVVGATGAGKTTIINLIGRFYDVQRGSVRIGTQDVRDFRKADLRERLGYVFQDPFLFAGTVAENISLLNPDLTREDLIRAAETVNAHGFISAMAEGYDTQLNERGQGLSLGEKQLVSMARTLAQNPELLFVLDEATASIDTATEMLIQEGLNRLMAGRTSIVIAHRLSTIRHADRILVMRHGELIDEGSHNDLMERDGYYRHLHELLQHSPP